MAARFAALSHAVLRPGTVASHPPVLPDRVYLDSPALDVMTDFAWVRPRTVRPDVPIDVALERMRTEGVRLLLVTDERSQIVGAVSSYDIQGERPVQLAGELRVARGTLVVEQIMLPQPRIPVVHLLSVRHAQVGHVVETLRAIEQRHLLVVETEGLTDEAVEAAATRTGVDADPWGVAARLAPPERSGEQWVRGLFSAAQIGRQLRLDIEQVMVPAHSLAEMVRGIA